MEKQAGGYVPTIGLEIHAELKTLTKMFCGSLNAPHESEPNTHVCPICMGHPGTLPTINHEAVKQVLMVGLALEGKIATYTEFDRKNYFYPDIPKGYQISQYKYPLVSGGELNGIKITRVHLEEDTARSQHEGDTSLVDYNRAGVPLMELVTEPVIHDAKTAGDFARELQLLLRISEVSMANMEKGEMRVEANISVSKGNTLGTKVEVKNLNSFRSVEMAIAYEIERQSKLLDEGGVVVQETRGWDEEKKITYTQRKKESSHDYRYFPDPDLPSLVIDKIEEFTLSRLSEIMPKIPSKIRKEYLDLGLTSDKIQTILADNNLRKFFDLLVREESSKDVLRLGANYLTSDVLSIISERTCDLSDTPQRALAYKELMELISNKNITSRIAKDILPEVIFDLVSPKETLSERGLLAPEVKLDEIITKVILNNQTAVLEVKQGKVTAIQFLVGQGMKLSRGAADPEVLRRTLEEKINE